MFDGLDHLAIVVGDTDEALRTWRDRFGFPVLFTELIGDGDLRVTHLDLGNTHLQLIEPLRQDHPLKKWLEAHGPGLHHFCLKVKSIESTAEEMRGSGLKAGEPHPHQGTQGQKALFLDLASTGGIQVEITGASDADGARHRGHRT
jgi:methylmalonyl-CoA/ethylmalonyl-CoA epimerase